MERATLEPDVVYIALYDADGRRLRAMGPGPVEAPPVLDQKPAPGRIVHAWRSSPPLVLSTFATEKRYFVLALEPGPGRRSARIREAAVDLHSGRGRRARDPRRALSALPAEALRPSARGGRRRARGVPRVGRRDGSS